MPDELDDVNDGSNGANDVIGADDDTAGSPARAAGVGMTPSDDPTVTYEPLNHLADDPYLRIMQEVSTSLPSQQYWHSELNALNYSNELKADD